jgi:uncharacterized protein DUF6713
MMNKQALSVNLYLVNAALLFTHEIDSAFWKEWELFGIPGGIQLFLLLNFLLLLGAFVGFKQLIQGTGSGYAFALLLAGSGVFAFTIHSYFILTGHSEFTLPASLTLLALILIVSLAQGFWTLKEWRPKS